MDKGYKHSKGKSLPSLNDIFQGQIASVKEYGAFVKIPGCFKDGLVHISQISKCPVDNVSEVVSVGDKVWCKVTSIGENDKISLSMKIVDQGNGKDLDPNGVNMSQDDKKRRAFGTHNQPKIQLEAVFNTVCKKCGTKGHLARDCFHVPGSKTYELLTDETKSHPSNPAINTNVETTNIKEKKRKHDSDTSSESNSSSSEPKPKRKKEKSKHKHKKKKSHSKKKKRH
ncbi:Nucleolar protein of 40 kDa [Chamberlinius hualienensis]